jgi:hypothetical protein
VGDVVVAVKVFGEEEKTYKDAILPEIMKQYRDPMSPDSTLIVKVIILYYNPPSRNVYLCLFCTIIIVTVLLLLVK